MAVPIGAAFSQSAPASAPHTLSLRIDNDAFDFWMAPWNRPDEEYTSGVHITYDGGDAPRWARFALKSRGACTTATSSCRSGGVEIGQDIYTPSVSLQDPHAGAGTRPNAGWLYVSQHAAALDAAASRDFSIALGVTGPPSLAQTTQRLAHDVAPAFNRPTDWSREIEFEPGLIAKYEMKHRFAAVDATGTGIELVPRLSGSAGNILTLAEAGFQTRLGWHLAHPWLPTPGGFGLSLLAGAFGQGVARNIFLDGNTFASSPHVGHEPFVGGGEAGIELRYGGARLSYRAVSQTREWSGGPRWHPWSSLAGSFTFGR